MCSSAQLKERAPAGLISELREVSLRHPYALSPSLRRQIKVAFEEAAQEVCSHDREYVNRRLPSTVALLAKNGANWKGDLGRAALALFKVMESSGPREEVEPKSADALITAALFYLCNPFDFIPDFTPGKGYADDVLVMNVCLKTLRHDHKAIYHLFLRALDRTSE